MLSALYKSFLKLYEGIQAEHPSLASEHALEQELEIYGKTNKATYRSAVITCITTLKKRTPPTSITSDTVGTDSQVNARLAAKKEYSALVLTPEDLKPHLLTPEQMKELEFVIEVPEEWGPGGDKVNELGETVKCERCAGEFVVKKDPYEEECEYHFGKPYMVRTEGKKEKQYRCCSKPHPSPGCSKGAHVFYTSDPQTLHSRYPFSPLSDLTSNLPTHLKIAAMDCEMVYTTAGMSVARASVVNELGEVVFDEFVKMSEGVDILDYNTRFSGISSLEKAKLDLTGIRKELQSIIGPETILIGHALDNDLRTLRIVHHRVIDTVMLFPHPHGLPLRRALRDLVANTLGHVIQAGSSSSGEGGMGSIGHSSVEDSRATLNLVKWWIHDQRKRA
ncbi:RNA exonuclease 3 [Tulasnella sp. 418]|nr:RNA exonuclease 3 [Tulasnella sp. 418]